MMFVAVSHYFIGFNFIFSLTTSEISFCLFFHSFYHYFNITPFSVFISSCAHRVGFTLWFSSLPYWFLYFSLFHPHCARPHLHLSNGGGRWHLRWAVLSKAKISTYNLFPGGWLRKSAEIELWLFHVINLFNLVLFFVFFFCFGFCLRFSW